MLGPIFKEISDLEPFLEPFHSNEADDETWRTNVDFLLIDPAISDLDRTLKIFDSLLPPATDVLKHLGP